MVPVMEMPVERRPGCVMAGQEGKEGVGGVVWCGVV